MDKQVAVKKTELALKRSKVELETYKNLARDASDIMEAEDFNRVRNSYNGKVSFDVNKLSHNISTGGTLHVCHKAWYFHGGIRHDRDWT